MSPAPQAEVMLRNAGASAIRLRTNDRTAVTATSHHKEFFVKVEIDSVKTPFE
jgi:hypothetical protein